MPHVSRHKLSKKTEEELLRNLNLVLTHIGNNDEMISFIDALFTSTEKVMLSKRLALIILIEEGLQDSQIADILHMTVNTVAKMRMLYELKGQGFKVAIRKLKEQKQLEGFKKLLISLARYSIRAAGGYVKPTILD